VYHVRNSDIVLGGDWLEVVSLSLTSMGICDPVSSDIDRLPDGHWWIPSPSIVSRQSLSLLFTCYDFTIDVLVD